MSRAYHAVFDRVIRHPKFLRLSPAGRLGLFYVWCLAGEQDPEAKWHSRSDLTDALALYDIEPEAVEELIAQHWLDVDDAGAVWVHDWDDHQVAASRAIRNRYEAARLREWRRDKAAQEEKGDSKKKKEEIRGEEIRGETDTYEHETFTGARELDGGGSATRTTSRKGRGAIADEEIPDNGGLGSEGHAELAPEGLANSLAEVVRSLPAGQATLQAIVQRLTPTDGKRGIDELRKERLVVRSVLDLLDGPGYGRVAGPDGANYWEITDDGAAALPEDFEPADEAGHDPDRTG